MRGILYNVYVMCYALLSYVTKRYCAAVVIIILVHLKTRVTIRGVIPYCYTVFSFFVGTFRVDAHGGHTKNTKNTKRRTKLK